MARTAAPTTFIGTPDAQALYGMVLSDWWETTADLIWPQSVITYGRMRHDPQLHAVLSAYLLPIMRATWVLDPDGCRDEVVQHCADDLGVGILGTEIKPGPARRRGVVWQRHLKAALYDQLVYGYKPFELRYRFDDAGLAHLDALGPRMPWSISHINLNHDGTLSSVLQNSQKTPIPANRLIWYVNDLQGSNWTGISALRTCFGAWLLKHEAWRVHATSIRRFGMGVPTVEAPAGATQTQVQQAQQLAAQMRTGDQAGMGLPQGFKPYLLGMTGSVPDALAFIEYLDRVMAKQALASLIELGQTETGSRALGETFMDLFTLSLQAVADEAAVVATSGQDGMPGIITDLVNQNWGEDEPAPRMVCTDVGTQYQLTADAVQKLTEFGALQPDESLDAHIREQWHLPARTAPWEPPPSSTPAAPRHESPELITPAAPAALPAAAASRSTRTRASAPGVLRRKLTKIEAAAGYDPQQRQSQWTDILEALLTVYAGITRVQRDEITGTVESIIASGKTSGLASISVDATAGSTALAEAMAKAYEQASDAMLLEAAHQGVTIDVTRIQPASMADIAAGRATMAASYLAQQAGSRAMRAVQPGLPAAQQASTVSGNVAEFLDGLSDRYLRDQLGGALTAAQNAGRVGVFEAAPDGVDSAVYVGSEVLDNNVCGPCRDEDGQQFESFEAAVGAYPTGGFIDCQGGDRCRGTLVALWGDLP
jgi:hypothetical protein